MDSLINSTAITGTCSFSPSSSTPLYHCNSASPLTTTPSKPRQMAWLLLWRRHSSFTAALTVSLQKGHISLESRHDVLSRRAESKKGEHSVCLQYTHGYACTHRHTRARRIHRERERNIEIERESDGWMDGWIEVKKYEFKK